jgi:hypothetical protein
MSNSSSRARVAKPVRVAPLLTRYVPVLAMAATGSNGAPPVRSPVRSPLVTKTMFGVTVNRFRDGVELVYSDGRKITASSPLGLLVQMFRRGSK